MEQGGSAWSKFITNVGSQIHSNTFAEDTSHHACTEPYRLQQTFLEGVEGSDGDGSTGHVRSTEQDRETGHQHTSAQHPAGR